MMEALSYSVQAEPTAVQGAEFKNEKGTVRVRPSASSDELRVYAEAASVEIAAELCEDFERRIKMLDSLDGK